MKTLIILIVFALSIVYSEKSYSVGGISNSKVIVPSAETVPKNRFEIEPFFDFAFLDDSIDTKSFNAGVRITLGTTSNMEIGTNINYLSLEDSDNTDTESALGGIDLGVKYRILDQSETFPFSIAYQGGISYINEDIDDIWNFEPLGLIITKNFTEKFSLDADIVFNLTSNQDYGLVSNLGVGYYITEKFQPVIETAYLYEDPDSEESIGRLNATAGFTSPINDMLTIIFGITYDLYTDNTDNELTITAAFTFLF